MSCVESRGVLKEPKKSNCQFPQMRHHAPVIQPLHGVACGTVQDSCTDPMARLKKQQLMHQLSSCTGRFEDALSSLCAAAPMPSIL